MCALTAMYQSVLIVRALNQVYVGIEGTARVPKCTAQTHRLRVEYMDTILHTIITISYFVIIIIIITTTTTTTPPPIISITLV